MHVTLVSNFGQYRSKLKYLEVSVAESLRGNWETEEPIPMGLLERASLNHNPVIVSRSF
jgi:hypothetical protein